MDFQFEHIELLPAFAVLFLPLLLFVLALFHKKAVLKKLGNYSLVKNLTRYYSPANFLLKFIFLALALTAIIGAVINPQKPGQSKNVKRAGVDIVIALDVSKSMLAEDIKPNRLEKSRQLIYKLLDELKEDRVGLVLFAGHAYLQMPLTTDQSAARIYIQNASTTIVPTQGTVIGEALKMSNSAFNSKERKFKSIVLITDGEDHDPEAENLGASLASNGVMINTIGVGSPEGITIIDPATDSYKKDAVGQPVISKLNEALLQKLATTTNGIYNRLENIPEVVKKIRTQLNTIEKSSLEDSSFRDYDSYFYWLIGIGLLFLVLEFLWPERKWKIA